MHINSSLYNAEIIQEPWPHVVIDDFFTEETWKKLSQIPEYILDPLANQFLTDRVDNAREKTRGGNVFSLEDLLLSGVPEDIVECYWDACAEILENRETIYGQFPEHRPDNNSLMKPCLNLDFKGNWYEPHPDSKAKLISLICYLDPVESEGTSLHTNQHQDSLVKTVDWKPNRCMVFCPGRDTWHSFKCPSEHRLVLAIFVELDTGDKLENHLNFSSGKTATFWSEY